MGGGGCFGSEACHRIWLPPAPAPASPGHRPRHAGMGSLALDAGRGEWGDGRGGGAFCHQRARRAAAHRPRTPFPLTPPSHLPSQSFLPAPLEKSHLFNARYVPFAAVEAGNGAASKETYSLDDVIYRAADGGLLDVQHDMEVMMRV